MTTARRHPIGVGTYDVYRLDAPNVRVRFAGHTAYEAWKNACAKLGCASFGECDTDLVSDAPPEAAA